MKYKKFSNPLKSVLLCLTLVSLTFFGGGSCNSENETPPRDRSRLSLSEALVGHWKSAEGLLSRKHEYYELVQSETADEKAPYKFYYYLSWSTSLGEESEGKILNLVHKIDEKNNTIILKSKSSDGVYTYYTRYRFNQARNEFISEEIDEKTDESRYDIQNKFVFIDDQVKADHIK